MKWKSARIKATSHIQLEKNSSIFPQDVIILKYYKLRKLDLGKVENMYYICMTFHSFK